eukprot:Gregarina_sp_Poly_1__11406@NODE_96_length_14647_cov_152_270302_g83_i0_p13_GENE_NODE_96_length_14647_cov_152_270302_g83_i0NODE_96_length_14647_cov_152_270302_g83_i0_p13_ORF_typecomplete_len154_score15_38DnaJ/PF00226_31/2_3e07zfCSL/PF05207_13/0_00028SAB/PF04382_13/0_09PMI_typeI/PF01238_21/0_25_NODE_96_length_14647_cov_152_270302_g83_i084828943
MDPWAILDVQPGSSISELRRSFLWLALQVHPDKALAATEDRLPLPLRSVQPSQRFNFLAEAYQCAKNNLLTIRSQPAFWANAIPVIIDGDCLIPENSQRSTYELHALEPGLLALVCRCGTEEFIDRKQLISNKQDTAKIACTGCSQKYNIVFV